MSQSTEARDRGVKLKLYRRQGVGQYWIVDPVAENVEVWRFEGDEPRCERFDERLPVRLAEEVIGGIDLREISRRD